MNRDERVRWLLWSPKDGFSVLDMRFVDGVLRHVEFMYRCTNANDCDTTNSIGVEFEDWLGEWQTDAFIGGWGFWGNDHIANAVLDKIANIIRDFVLIAEHTETEEEE